MSPGCRGWRRGRQPPGLRLRGSGCGVGAEHKACVVQEAENWVWCGSSCPEGPSSPSRLHTRPRPWLRFESASHLVLRRGAHTVSEYTACLRSDLLCVRLHRSRAGMGMHTLSWVCVLPATPSAVLSKQ